MSTGIVAGWNVQIQALYLSEQQLLKSNPGRERATAIMPLCSFPGTSRWTQSKPAGLLLCLH